MNKFLGVHFLKFKYYNFLYTKFKQERCITDYSLSFQKITKCAAYSSDAIQALFVKCKIVASFRPADSHA